MGLQRRDQRVADLMVGDDLLFPVGHHRALALRARDDGLDALLDVGLGEGLAPLSDGPQRRFVDDVGELRAGSARRRPCDDVPVDVRLGLDVLCVDGQDGLAAL